MQILVKITTLLGEILVKITTLLFLNPCKNLVGKMSALLLVKGIAKNLVKTNFILGSILFYYIDRNIQSFR